MAYRRAGLRVRVLLARGQLRLQEGPLPQLHARDGQQQRLRHGYASAVRAGPTLVQRRLQELLAVGSPVEGPGQCEREVNQTAGGVRRVQRFLHHSLAGTAAIALVAHALALQTLAVLAALRSSQRRVGQRPPQRTRSSPLRAGRFKLKVGGRDDGAEVFSPRDEHVVARGRLQRGEVDGVAVGAALQQVCAVQPDVLEGGRDGRGGCENRFEVRLA